MDVEVSEQHRKRLEIILQGMRWPVPKIQLCATGTLLKLVETGGVPIQTVMRPEILSTCIQFLEEQNPHLQLLTCKLFANVASELPEAATTLLRTGIAPVLAKLLKSPERSVEIQSLWTLAILSENGPEAPNFVWKATVLPTIKNFNTKHLWTIIHDMDTLIKIKYPTRPLNVVRACLPVLAQFLSAKNGADIVVSDCSLIAFLIRPSSDGNSVDNVNRIQVFMEAGVDQKLFNIISSLDVEKEIVILVLTIIKHMASGNDQQRYHILGLGCLDHVTRFVKHPCRKVYLSAYQVVVNICAGGNPDHIQMVMDSEVFTELLKIMKTSDSHLETPALVLAYIAFYGSKEHIKRIVEIILGEGGVEMITSFFSLFAHSISLYEDNVALRSLENLLEASAVTGQALPLITNIESSGGFAILTKLQQHTSQKNSAEASDLLETQRRIFFWFSQYRDV